MQNIQNNGKTIQTILHKYIIQWENHKKHINHNETHQYSLLYRCSVIIENNNNEIR